MTTNAQLTLPVLGELPSQWTVVEFGSVLDGGTRNGIYKSKEFHGRGDKIVNMGELFAYPRLFSVPMKRVELSEKEKNNFRLQIGDLLFARRSLVAEGAGKCSIVCDIQEPTTFESSIIRARPHPQIADSFYLYYLFSSSYGSYALDTIRRQVAVSGITGTDLVKLKIPLPPLDEQKAIAHILGTLDDKIELNQQMNQTLEAIQWTLFKSWFTGDFPDSWQLLPLEECMEAIIDYRGKTPKKTDSGIPLITAKIVKNGWISQPQEFISLEDYDEWMRRGIPKRGDVVMTTEAPLGEIAKLNGKKVALAQRLITLRGKSGLLNNTYLKFLMQSSFVQDQLHARASGSTVLGIKQSELRQITLPVPPFAEQEQIIAPLKTIEDKIDANEEESLSLQKILNSLLPKLLAGEIQLHSID